MINNNNSQENRIMRIIASIIAGIFGSMLGLALFLLIFGGISYIYLLITNSSFENAGTMVIVAGLFFAPLGLIAMFRAGIFAGQATYDALSRAADGQPDILAESTEVPLAPADNQPVKQNNGGKKVASIVIGLLASLLVFVPIFIIAAIVMYTAYFMDEQGMFGGAGMSLFMLALLCLTLFGITGMIGAGIVAGKTAYRKFNNDR